MIYNRVHAAARVRELNEKINSTPYESVAAPLEAEADYLIARWGLGGDSGQEERGDKRTAAEWATHAE